MDGRHVVYAGEVAYAAKAALLGGARALVYPVQAAEPFGLVLADGHGLWHARRGARPGRGQRARRDGVTGIAFPSLDALVAGLPRVLALDRARVRAAAVERFGVNRMVDAHVEVYARLVQHGSRGCRA